MLTLKQIRSSLSSRPSATSPPPGIVRASVLIPLVVENSGIQVLLTKRTELVEHHKGQISFPGGTADTGDKDAIATALREAEEEIGLDPRTVEVLGFLDDLETPTGFLITPIAGLLSEKPSLRLSKEEVEEAFWIPVDFFLDPTHETTGEREWNGKRHTVYSYQFGDHRIWGATAAMLRAFLRKASD